MKRPATVIDRPNRWSEPFAHEPLSDSDVASLLKTPILAALDASRFPERLPLASILKFDSRICDYHPGDIVVREGEFGTSAFFILEGTLDVVLPPGIPDTLLGRLVPEKKSLIALVKESFGQKSIPEERDIGFYGHSARSGRHDSIQVGRLQDMAVALDGLETVPLQVGEVFGELAALGRMPRSATVVAATSARCLEVRWQGLRDLRKYDPGLKAYIDARYRERALKTHLMQIDLFSDLDEQAIGQIADACQFETYGSFDWHVDYKKHRDKGVLGEIEINREGDYADSLILVRAGFVRVSKRIGAGEQTLNYLGAGSHFGLPEIYDAYRQPDAASLCYEATLTAVGYVDIIRVPSIFITQHLGAHLVPDHVARARAVFADRSIQQTELIEWAVDQRLINARQGMVIDLDKCTRCDDCVRACASTHDGNPRFRRQGPVFDQWMVAQSCMHCHDPVCLIGCPTGAISRDSQDGSVSINDRTCIGCATCANSCPYENIVMVNIRDAENQWIVDASNTPVVKATKCDLCQTNPAGPACERACPHGALKRTDLVSLLQVSGEPSS